MFSAFRDFDEDPFFSAHRERMSGMDQPFFGGMGFPAAPRIRDGNQQGQDGGARGRGMVPFDPFAGMGMGMGGMGGMGGMLGMGSMFGRMEEQMRSMQNDPNSQSFVQSSVYSYSNTGAGAPEVYEAHSSTRKAPGGVKETKRAVRDTRTGTEKMAIGHHIGDRSHVIQKQKDSRTGAMEEEENLYNLDDSDKVDFNREWKEKTARAGHYLPRAGGRGPRHLPASGGGATEGQRALPEPKQESRVDRRAKRSREQRHSNY